MVDKINKKDVKPIDDSCGELRELYASEHISIAHNIVTGDAQKHKHKVLEEVYYVTKGEGAVIIGEEEIALKEGDTIAIPKNTWHYLKKIDGKEFEILVLTYPKWTEDDMIFEK